MMTTVKTGSPKKLLKYLKQVFFNTESKKRSNNKGKHRSVTDSEIIKVQFLKEVRKDS